MNDETEFHQDEAKEWLSAEGYIDAPSSQVTLETLKTVILQLSWKVDMMAETKEGMREIAFSLEELGGREVEKTVLEAVKKAMEGYKEILETLAEALVKMVKDMAEQAKEKRYGMDWDWEEEQVEELPRSQRGTAVQAT
ncbi:hypothetical protein C0995_011759 [Termitomyces sp. Mi166|nr:hypothetical protein C0995_011759 [Termitomyces sp. Mi166\